MINGYYLNGFVIRYFLKKSIIVWILKNFSLKADELLSIISPINDGSEGASIGIFSTDPEQTNFSLKEDAAIKAGVLI